MLGQIVGWSDSFIGLFFFIFRKMLMCNLSNCRYISKLWFTSVHISREYKSDIFCVSNSNLSRWNSKGITTNALEIYNYYIKTDVRHNRSKVQILWQRELHKETKVRLVSVGAIFPFKSFHPHQHPDYITFYKYILYIHLYIYWSQKRCLGLS